MQKACSMKEEDQQEEEKQVEKKEIGGNKDNLGDLS